MILFVSTDILLLAIGAILYLMVRALPRVAEEPSDRQGVLDRWAHSELPEKLDAAFDTFLIKFLRKLKVFIMRLDNALSKYLRKINAADDGTKVIVDFSDFASSRAVLEERELQEAR
jgi:hypothetical protein